LSDHKFVISDVFEFIDKCIIQRITFDVVVCDPPTVFNVGKTVLSCNKNYDIISEKVLGVVSDGGQLVFFNNSHSCKLEKWIECVNKGLSRCLHVKIEFVRYLYAANHYFEDTNDPDLKGVIYKVTHIKV
jgi:23S rRNA (cytosine1962-C5)-methyltransferase